MGVIAYFTWFYNPHEHTLRLNPEKVFAQRADHQGYLLTNANIVDVESGKINPKQHLIIIGEQIEKIYSGNLPDSLTQIYTVIDLEGQYILPGLFDMHSHLNSGGLIPPDESIRKSALEQFVRYGVTTIFTLGGHGFNEEITIDLKNQQQKKQIIAPKIFATGDILTAPGGYPISFLPMMLGKPMEQIDLKESGILVINESEGIDDLLGNKKTKGLDGVKIMVESNLGGNNPQPRLSNALINKISQKSGEYNLPVFAHTSRASDFRNAVEANVNVIAHTVGSHVMENESPTFQKMRRDSIYYTPTLSIGWMFQFVKDPVLLDDPFLTEHSSRRTTRSLENWPIRQLVQSNWSEESMQNYKVMPQNLKLMYDAGIPIMMGSDAGNLAVIPGYSAHLEMGFMVDAGMATEDVLRSATIIPARFLRIDDRTGSIAEGKVASFMVLEKNPLEDIRNTRSLSRVMHEGFWIE